MNERMNQWNGTLLHPRPDVSTMQTSVAWSDPMLERDTLYTVDMMSSHTSC